MITEKQPQHSTEFIKLNVKLWWEKKNGDKMMCVIYLYDYIMINFKPTKKKSTILHVKKLHVLALNVFVLTLWSKYVRNDLYEIGTKKIQNIDESCQQLGIIVNDRFGKDKCHIFNIRFSSIWWI